MRSHIFSAQLLSQLPVTRVPLEAVCEAQQECQQWKLWSHTSEVHGVLRCFGQGNETLEVERPENQLFDGEAPNLRRSEKGLSHQVDAALDS
jgi:hypothetical protein